jgi:hypothetical protein
MSSGNPKPVENPDCPCPNLECDHHGCCTDCGAYHKGKGNVPTCQRKQAPGRDERGPVLSAGRLDHASSGQSLDEGQCTARTPTARGVTGFRAPFGDWDLTRGAPVVVDCATDALLGSRH